MAPILPGVTAVVASAGWLPPSAPATAVGPVGAPLASSISAPSPFPSGVITLHTEAGLEVRGVVGDGVERPLRLITALHGMCYAGEDFCSLLRPIATGRGVLVCPRGNGVCTDGSPDWVIPTAATSVDDADRAIARSLGEPEARHDDVLVGSSRGAYAACHILADIESGPWSALVLIGASVDPDPASLRRAGIGRVLLAAPRFDVAAPAMQVAQEKLCRAGMPTRFVELGRRAHGLDAHGVELLASSMTWVMDRTPTAECPLQGGK